MLQTLKHLHDSVLDLVQHVRTFLAVGSPALDNPDVASPVMSREEGSPQSCARSTLSNAA